MTEDQIFDTVYDYCKEQWEETGVFMIHALHDQLMVKLAGELPEEELSGLVTAALKIMYRMLMERGAQGAMIQ